MRPGHAFGIRFSSALTFAMAVVVAAAPQQPSTAEFRLTRVDVTGANRYTAADVTTVSGLRVGERVSAASLQATAQQMSRTGLFKSVRYRYLTTASDMTVTFEIEEEAWTKPVVYDNFIWFSDEELTKGLREAVPSFDGTAPANQGASAFIAQALQRIVDARGITGRVEFISRVNLATGVDQHIFSVKVDGPSMKICALRVAGASAVSEGDLQSETRDVIGTDYSRSFLVDLANGTLRQAYRRRGHWAATFGPPAASMPGAGGCPGIAVSVTVDEGPAYRWERAEWSGAAAIPASELNRALGMASGAPAGLTAIDDGLRRVHTAYEKVGHLLQTATYQPRLDDAARTAVFTIAVAEGPQFRMGRLEFVGFPPDQVADLTRRWTLKAGDVYDASVVNQYRTDHLRPQRGGGGRPATRINVETRLDRAAQLAHVRVVQTPAGGGGRAHRHNLARSPDHPIFN